MKIACLEPDHPDRKIELEEQLQAEVDETIAEANDAGYGTEETIEALEGVIADARIAQDMDPDPADDPA